MNRSPSLWSLIKKMLGYAPWLFALDTVFWLAISGLPAIPGIIIREFFNGLTTKAPGIDRLIILFLAIGIAQIMAIFMGRITKTQHRFLMGTLVRHNLILQLMLRPGAEIITIAEIAISPGEVISFLRDDGSRIEDNVVATNEILGEAVFALTAVVILLNVNPLLTITVFVPLLGCIVIFYYLSEALKPYHRSSRSATQKVTGTIAEMFTTIETIKILGKEISITNHLIKLCQERQELAIKEEVFTSVLSSSMHNLVYLGIGILLLVTAQTSTIKPGDLALFIFYLTTITQFFNFLGGFVALSKQGEVAFERLTNLTNVDARSVVEYHPLYVPPLFSKVSPTPLPAIELPNRIPLQKLQINDLSYHFPNSNAGIKNISFTLLRGDFVVITGGIGAGKSTLLRVILGLLPWTRGAIFWNNQPILQPDRFLVPPRSAYTPQVPQLFSTSLRNNVLLGKSIANNDLDRVMATAAFEQDLLTMKDGLETIVGPNGVRLSGGQRQRIAAARAIVSFPELLVFDDISSALDYETEERMWDRLFSMGNQDWHPTFLVVSNRPQVLARASQIITIKDGTIVN